MKSPYEYSDTNSTHLRERADALDAQADGLPTQLMTPLGDWVEDKDRCTFYPTVRYRSKPTPVARFWAKPSDVPLNCWLQFSSSTENWLAFVSSIFDQGVAIVRREDVAVFTWGDIQQLKPKYTLDAINFLPCTTTEP